jgi:hypothetical protein
MIRCPYATEFCMNLECPFNADASWELKETRDETDYDCTCLCDDECDRDCAGDI